MFIPRSGLRNNSGFFTSSGSIRDNHDFDEEILNGKPPNKLPLPGPGEYNTDRSSFQMIGKP